MKEKPEMKKLGGLKDIIKYERRTDAYLEKCKGVGLRRILSNPGILQDIKAMSRIGRIDRVVGPFEEAPVFKNTVFWVTLWSAMN